MKVVSFLVLLIAALRCAEPKTAPCNLRNTKYGSVCVCTAAVCDYLENPIPPNPQDFVVVSSSKGGLRFATTNGQFDTSEKLKINDYEESEKAASSNETSFDPVSIVLDEKGSLLEYAYGASSGKWFFRSRATKSARIAIDRTRLLQTITGFGGAFTGSVSHIIQQLQQDMQDHIYRSFFHADGIGYNIVRMSIGGSDFDLTPWAYNEYPKDDPHLSNFTHLDERDAIKVQQLQRMQAVSGLDKIKIMAAAWSPPPWMKTNNDWTGYSGLKPEYYQTWADYHLQFVELMAAKNMPIWAISTGNEPLNGRIGFFFVHFMSLGWTPRSQAIWLADNLGPTIRNSKYSDLLIFGNDDQRYTYPAWFDAMRAARAKSVDYLDGLAVHWYWDTMIDPLLIDVTHRKMPGKLLLNTEACVGDKPWQTHGPELGAWDRAEQYIRDMLQDLQHAFNGWLDWNIVLDEQGGPNYVQNYVDAPIIVNTTNRAEFYKQPIFYAIGHFSKFIPEGSVRIEMEIPIGLKLDAVAFRRPDERIVAVLFNDDRVPLDLTIEDNVRGNIVINIPARSLHTIVYN